MFHPAITAMRCQKKGEVVMKKLFTYLFVVCISASVASADFLSELDGFEDDTPGSAPAGTGWSSTGVSVSNSNAHTGNNAAYFTTDSAATNTISVNSPTKAWTDFRIRPALGANRTPLPPIQQLLSSSLVLTVM